ncbi:helix-turn-helix transcriptional regulator [Massilia sp. P8910]|uniref:helix-turn-helix transcriptional regulator n=1 Tax=Massilia antarctica TaxID=2765360 RepID=UPI001E46A07E|nr:helix-turn-helix transcriptional regulator [Massilia antarctica]MCE3605845.1 helix-turn-helix transcriptional regulator [Massilia antarctica]
MDKNISTLLREIKTKQDWSQVRLAAELGTTQPTVNRILGGQDNCKISTFKAICALHEACFAGEVEATPT